MSLSRSRRRRLRLLPIMLCWAPPFGRRIRPLPVTLKRLAAARFVFILDMERAALMTDGIHSVKSRHRAHGRSGYKFVGTRAGVAGGERLPLPAVAVSWALGYVA